MIVEKAEKTGFCFGVRRAVTILERLAAERDTVETLGAVVHNEQVLHRLAGLGVRVANAPGDIGGDCVVTSSHGVPPELEDRLKGLGLDVISTTCPFVRRAQATARRLAEAGFYVVVFGSHDHPEVAGILGYARGHGLATTLAEDIKTLEPIPRRLGLLSQTTQIPACFVAFVKAVIDTALIKDSEIRVIDTICHDIRVRQENALALARRVGMMLVIGGRGSANTNRLAELCAQAVETHLIETADEINPAWLAGKARVGITSGASTPDSVVDAVVQKLHDLTP